MIWSIKQLVKSHACRLTFQFYLVTYSSKSPIPLAIASWQSYELNLTLQSSYTGTAVKSRDTNYMIL